MPLRVFTSTGTICSLKRPAAMAAAARCWLVTASSSCISRVMLVARGHVLGGDAHVDLLPRVVQDAQHVVDQACASPMRAP
jgi:hypothetical protein